MSLAWSCDFYSATSEVGVLCRSNPAARFARLCETSPRVTPVSRADSPNPKKRISIARRQPDISDYYSYDIQVRTVKTQKRSLSGSQVHGSRECIRESTAKERQRDGSRHGGVTHQVNRVPGSRPTRVGDLPLERRPSKAPTTGVLRENTTYRAEIDHEFRCLPSTGSSWVTNTVIKPAGCIEWPLQDNMAAPEMYSASQTHAPGTKGRCLLRGQPDDDCSKFAPATPPSVGDQSGNRKS